MRRAVILLALAGCGDDPARLAAEERLTAQVASMERRLASLEGELARREKDAEAEAAKPATPDKPQGAAKAEAVLQISLGRDGARIEGVLVPAEKFDGVLEERARKGGVRSVLLNVDPDLAQSEITTVLDRIKRSGIGGGNVALVRGDAPVVDDLGPDAEG